MSRSWHDQNHDHGLVDYAMRGRDGACENDTIMIHDCVFVCYDHDLGLIRKLLFRRNLILPLMFSLNLLLPFFSVMLAKFATMPLIVVPACYDPCRVIEIDARTYNEHTSLNWEQIEGK